MNKISETFLLTIAEVSATLLGLLRAPLRSSDVRGAWSCAVFRCTTVRRLLGRLIAGNTPTP
jgi:hypothetical protein